MTLSNIAPDYLKNPTNPDSTVPSSATSMVDGADPSLAPPAVGVHGLTGPITPSNSGAMAAGIGLTGSGSFGEANYEVFDPLNWMLDGLVDFPYSFTAIQGLEGQGMA